MFRLRIPHRIQKKIKLLKLSYRVAILENLEEIKDDPFIGKPLTRELTGNHVLRIGVYRIIYKINEKDKTINILSIGHRATIYK